MSEENIKDNPKPKNINFQNGLLENEFLKHEADRRELFKLTVKITLGLAVLMYFMFLIWVFFENQNNWHIGLMLVIPPTSLLGSLVAILRYKSSQNNASNDKEDVPTLPQIKQIVDILSPLKDLFK